MSIKFHHVNLCSENVQRLSEFYRSIFDLEGVGGADHIRIDSNDRYGGKVDFVTDGVTEFHLATRDLLVAFQNKQALNPLDRGHIAFRTDDIEAFKKRLDDKGIAYSDYGTWAVGGWYQIFFQDPDGNVVEVHQAGL